MASPGIEPGFYGLKFTALSARPNGLDESVWPEFVLFRIGEAIDSAEPQESSNRASSIATPNRVPVGLRLDQFTVRPSSRLLNLFFLFKAWKSFRFRGFTWCPDLLG